MNFLLCGSLWNPFPVSVCLVVDPNPRFGIGLGLRLELGLGLELGEVNPGKSVHIRPSLTYISKVYML